MTPRDRVLRCLNHERVDRVPLSDSLRPEVWNKPKKHFGTEDTETIRETLGFDFKNAGMGLAEDFRERAISTDWGGVVIPDGNDTYETEWGAYCSQAKPSLHMLYPLSTRRPV